MRAVVQRVTNASVVVGGKVVGEIGAGFLVLLGVAGNDTPEDANYLADKIAHLRIFNDEQGKMNLALEEIRGEVLIVSQFTLFGDARRGRRPSYTEAAEPNKANTLYEYMIEQLRGRGIRVATGVFQSMMQVNLTNDGPVTILLDSRKAF